MAKKRKLSKEDLSEVDNYEKENKLKIINGNKIKLEDISIKVKCLNEKQKEFKKLIEEKEIIIASGSSGTGKTFLSLLMALHLLKTESKYQKIVLIKSLQVIKGEELGYLKGTLEDKISPYMFSFSGNLDKIFGTKVITKSLIDSGIIEIMPIAYIRGVNIDGSICIIDEIENITMDTFKTIITRIGSNSKFIFLGDVEQCDRANKKESCLSKVMELFKNEDYMGILEFSDEDCVRNPLIPKILNILNKKE